MFWIFLFYRLLFFESEYHDEENKKKADLVSKNNRAEADKQIAPSNNLSQNRKLRKKKSDPEKESSDVPLLDLGNEKTSSHENSQVTNHEGQHMNSKKTKGNNCTLCS